jgi:hypothetical protein
MTFISQALSDYLKCACGECSTHLNFLTINLYKGSHCRMLRLWVRFEMMGSFWPFDDRAVHGTARADYCVWDIFGHCWNGTSFPPWPCFVCISIGLGWHPRCESSCVHRAGIATSTHNLSSCWVYNVLSWPKSDLAAKLMLQAYTHAGLLNLLMSAVSILCEVEGCVHHNFESCHI